MYDILMILVDFSMAEFLLPGSATLVFGFMLALLKKNTRFKQMNFKFKFILKKKTLFFSRRFILLCLRMLT